MDNVAKQLLSLAYRFKKFAEIRVGRGIRNTHRISICHDFDGLFSKSSNWADFASHSMDELHELVKIENKYIRRRSKKYSADEFSWRNVRAQYRELRKKLFEEARKQQFLRTKIEENMLEIADGKSQGKSTAKLGTELKMLLSECWWELRNGSWIVRQFEVVNYIRSTKSVWEGNEEYARILSRSCLRKAAKIHMGSLISIIGNHNRGQTWEIVLTEIQLRTLGLRFHECDPLVDELIRKLRKGTSIRALLKRPAAQKQRNSKIKISPVVDRQMK